MSEPLCEQDQYEEPAAKPDEEPDCDADETSNCEQDQYETSC